MRKRITLLLVFILSFSLLTPTESDANVLEKGNANNNKERVIVLFKEKADKQLISNAKGQIHREYKAVPALAITVPPTAIKGLQKNPNVIAVEKDVTVKISSQTQDWGIQRINAPKTWSGGITGKGIKVAVVDTGIAAHDDLSIAGGVSFTSYTPSYQDDNGHGTHAAGIIGAKNNTIGTVGVAPDASLYAVKALDANGSGYLSDIIAGIDWSINNKMNIINLSLGTPTGSLTLKETVDRAYNQGILVVAAAGNSGTVDGAGDTVNYPAYYDSTIAVAATNNLDSRASFSSTGNAVDVAAPGERILSTYIGNQYVYMSGTSMAAPYVSGNLALLKQANPTLAAAELRSKLEKGTLDIGIVGKDAYFGFGLIQAPIVSTNNTTPVSLKINTTLTTNKTSYLAGETVSIYTKAVDANGSALSNATVTLMITSPTGGTTSVKAQTDSNGMITCNMSTTRYTTKGTYKVKAETTKLNYTSSSATTSFQIR
ncbi:S8 family peptidase [Ureibacillus sinduriensis]|uniref:Peptidase S8/S53 subtilisin kexin sedolisin n=1 Tax=Ureibacillus sinduriensis BLB-1 = JCM 15800 TaxID=1384057 RepID=A0A0A3HW54_9BACL|nr:S8 family peptidase [Ureibacillus sinduriensis]KGR75440.1 peptidase S8/S53 subtilisin kexin sedolisin [Ureibacillus sinduriensis BLB-1 = JCM 15800]